MKPEPLNWYEATLSLEERRKRGHFSTPPALVEQILDACHYTPDHDLTQFRVLDPACGSGNFLVAAARRLNQYSTHTALSLKARTALIQRNIWGFDPDPISCFLAQMQLGQLADTSAQLQIHQGDALALPWHEPRFDLFLANPPYLAAKNTDLSAYRSTQQHGQTDSYLLFLQLGLQLVHPHGWLGLVLPDPVLARTNASAARKRLLQDFTIHHLWHLAGVFAAQVGAVVLIAQKCPPHSTHMIAWTRSRWDHPKMREDLETRRGDPRGGPRESHQADKSATIPQTLLSHQPHAELRYLLGQEQGTIIERLRTYLDENTHSSSHFAPLSNFLSIRRGEEIGQASPRLICRADPCGRPGNQPSPCLTGNSVWYPVLRGGRDVRSYNIAFNEWWIERQAIVKPLERYLAPKLLVVKSTGRLQAALDTHGHVALQTLYLLYACSANATVDDLYFYLALLNSQLLQTYTYVLHTAYKWVQPQIEQHVLAHLPIPTIPFAEKKTIIERAKLLTRPCDNANPVVEWKEHKQHLYAEQERAIRAIYDAALQANHIP